MAKMVTISVEEWRASFGGAQTCYIWFRGRLGGIVEIPVDKVSIVEISGTAFVTGPRMEDGPENGTIVWIPITAIAKITAGG